MPKTIINRIEDDRWVESSGASTAGTYLQLGWTTLEQILNKHAIQLVRDNEEIKQIVVDPQLGLRMLLEEKS